MQSGKAATDIITILTGDIASVQPLVLYYGFI
jgi:hypothetical protein